MDACCDRGWPVERWSWWVVAPAVVMVGLLLASAARYGFHRDELYFIESAKHLAWGYVDNPPLTPLLGRLSRGIFGDSLFGLRVVPAVEAGLVVVAVAALAREFGARAAAQVLAAILTATASFVLAIGHLLTTPTLDVLVTVLMVWCLVRMVRTGDQRWWLLVGIAVGIGLENKFTIAVSVVALATGAVVTRSWRPFVSVWTLAGAAVAVALWAPNLWWQAHHGWTLLSFSRAIARDQGADNRAQLIPFQLLVLGPPVAPVLVAGIRGLWRRPAWRSLRFLPVGYAILLVLLIVSGGKGYYAAGLVLPFAASGAITTVEWMDRRRRARRHLLLTTAVVVNAAVGAIITLPVLPQRLVGGAIAGVNHDAAETIGWPAFADQVATAVATVPAADRSTVVILTANYGEAGAIDRYGPSRGIGPAYSGHNSYTTFRVPSDTRGPVVAIGFDDLADDAALGDCTTIATIRTPAGIGNDENGTRIWRCTGPTQPWSKLWPSLAHEG